MTTNFPATDSNRQNPYNIGELTSPFVLNGVLLNLANFSDTIQFELTENTLVTLTFASVQGNYFRIGRDDDQDGVFDTEEIDFAEVTSVRQIELDLSAGTYFVEVQAGSWWLNNDPSSPGYVGTDVYQLSFSVPIQPDRFEPNDTLTDTTILTPTNGIIEEIDLTIHDGDTQDLFLFTLDHLGTNSNYVQIDFNHNLGDLDLRLYRVGTSLELVGISESSNNQELISLSNLSQGDYLVQILGFQGATSPDYDLTINLQIEPDRFEPNDTLTDTTILTTTDGTIEEVNLSIHEGDTQDLFLFTLEGIGTSSNFVGIGFDHSLGDLDLRLFRLEESSLVPITSSETSNNQELISLIDFAPGNYLVQVFGYQGATNPNYDLIINLSQAPNDIILSNNVINENEPSNSVIGSFATADNNTGDAFIYSLVNGTGDTDNSAFTIVDNTLRVSSSLDFETKSSYSIRVQTTDQSGLSYEEVFTINVNDLNEAPTNINLSNNAIAEGVATGTKIGLLAASDPDQGDSHTYSLVTSGVPFAVVGNELRTAGTLDFETQSSYSLTIQAQDAGGATFDKVFTINISDVVEINNIRASEGNNVIDGTAGVDRLSALDSGNTLNGLAGNDLLVGGSGDDILNGGAGADRMLGRGGIDTYQYDNFSDSLFASRDTIIGFTQSKGDRFDINATIASARNLGVISASSLSQATNIAGSNLGTIDAVFFQFGSLTYLMVDNGDNVLNSNSDLFIANQRFGFGAGDGTANTDLTVSNYFV